MSNTQIHAVTGAFGFSGKYIARLLLEKGHKVITLTNSTQRKNSFEGTIDAFPFHFEEPDRLAESLQGVSVLYNTYWVRFNYKLFKYIDAVQNTLVLFEAAKKAGVKRIVHVSITNPSEDSPLEYFNGKAKLEKALIESGMSYAILRPAVLFGNEDVLINNISWGLRRFPVFGVFGNGKYRIQPIYVEDLAELAVEQGESKTDCIINAIGPETYTYKAMVEMVKKAMGKKRLIMPVPPSLAYLAATIMGKILGDVMLTRDEITGLMQELLYVDAPPTGKTKLSEWVMEHADTIGKKYNNELARRKDRVTGY